MLFGSDDARGAVLLRSEDHCENPTCAGDIHDVTRSRPSPDSSKVTVEMWRATDVRSACDHRVGARARIKAAPVADLQCADVEEAS